MFSAKKGAFVFLITLFISFIVLSSIFLIFFIFSQTDKANTKQEEIPYNSEYVPRQDESIAILLIGCEMPQDLPDYTMLVYYDALKGIIYPISLPSVTVSTSNGRVDTLMGHYDYAGVHGCMNGVKTALGIELDRYARFQKQGISNMVDTLGGVSYELQSDRFVGDEKLLKGEQLLDGRRVSTLIFAHDEQSAPDFSLQSEMLLKLIEQAFNEKLVYKYDSLVSNIFLNCETNLNHYDFAKRKTAFLNYLRTDTLVATEIKVTGDYNKDFTEFYISDESVDEIKKIINIAI